MLVEPLEPVRPLLAAAQRDGRVSPEQVHIIQRVLVSVDRPGFDPADIAAGEALLTSFAASFGPKELSVLAEKTVDATIVENGERRRRHPHRAVKIGCRPRPRPQSPRRHHKSNVGIDRARQRLLLPWLRTST
jgi:hypothetical protein